MPFQSQSWPRTPQISAHRNPDFPQMFSIGADRFDFYGGLLVGIRNVVKRTYLRHSAECRRHLASTKQRGYWLANNKLLSGSVSNSEATSRASTRSALLHLFQSSIQSVFHLMLGEMEACRARLLDNSGQRFDNDCRRPTALAASPSMSGIVRHPICVDARCYARDASQYVGEPPESAAGRAHDARPSAQRLAAIGLRTAAVFPGEIAGASLKLGEPPRRSLGPIPPVRPSPLRRRCHPYDVYSPTER
jgi:hypothetical protein